MASNLTVKVHPIVYMSIVDAYERKSSSNINSRVGTVRSVETTENRALGTLLGFYEKNVVQVTSCYAVPFRETSDDIPEINDALNRQMWHMSKRTSPSEQIVGWFFTVPDLSEMCPHYHGYYTGLVNETPRKEPPPIILITMDFTFSGESADRLPIKAYAAREAGVPGKGATQATIFYPLKVEMDVFPGESVALSFIMRGLDSERREIKFANSQEQLLENGEQMVDWLEKMLGYVKRVLDGGETADPLMGRKLMEIVSLANTQLPAEKMKCLVDHSLRDYLMVSLLANLAKTQLALQEKVTSA
ncbi:hypothetical protein niasHT_015752 [Heterodera trifolii]|uniref:MPN domain-containing protein n=1 Tax=Heterodera trifolii TaxID=157864 RepID=A0ABD2L4X1_9BILA